MLRRTTGKKHSDCLVALPGCVAFAPSTLGSMKKPSQAAQDMPIAYLERVREYYQALGYGAPYVWAQYDDVPLHRLPKPLSACRVALITTAAPYQPDKGDQGPGAPYNAAAKFFSVYSGDTALGADLRIAHVSIDRQHTRADDINAYFPLAALHDCASSGRIGAVAPRFHGLPTQRSQRLTLEVDGPEILARCRADGADAAILVPQLPRLPPKREPGRALAGGQRHRHRDHGQRQRYR